MSRATNTRRSKRDSGIQDIYHTSPALSRHSGQDELITGLAEQIWDYHLLHHTLQHADVIVALGSHDLRVACHAAQLWLAGWAPLLVTSGGRGRLTAGLFERTEAWEFARAAVEMGVPADAIVVEDRSTNTAENVLFTRDLLISRGCRTDRIIAVHKPYMERRTYATWRKMWPQPELIVVSPPISFSSYPTACIPRDEVIDLIVGDLHRILVYADRGFQIPQPVPAPVRAAFDALVRLGFDRQLAR